MLTPDDLYKISKALREKTQEALLLISVSDVLHILVSYVASDNHNSINPVTGEIMRRDGKIEDYSRMVSPPYESKRMAKSHRKKKAGQKTSQATNL